MSTKQNVNVESEIEHLMAVVSEQAKALAELHARVRARGTRDLAPVQALPQTPADKIERACRGRPQTLVELAHALECTPGEAIVAVRKLGDRVYNLGTESSPRWIWRVGDEGLTPELVDTVAAIIADRPMLMRDLVEATGARIGRVSGAIVKLQRDGRPVQNLGTPTVARWFLAPTLAKK